MSSRTYVPDKNRFDHVLQVGLNEMQRLKLAGDNVDANGGSTGKRKRNPRRQKVDVEKLNKAELDNIFEQALRAVDVNGDRNVSPEEIQESLKKHNLDSNEFKLFQEYYATLLEVKNDDVFKNSFTELATTITRSMSKEVIERQKMFKEIAQKVEPLKNLDKVQCSIEILYGYMRNELMQFLLRMKSGETVDNILKSIPDNKKDETRATLENLNSMIHFYNPAGNVQNTWCFDYDAVTLMGKINKSTASLLLHDNDIKTRFDRFTGKLSTDPSGIEVDIEQTKFQFGTQEFNIVTEYVLQQDAAKKSMNPNDDTFIPSIVSEKLATQFKFYTEFLRKQGKGKNLKTLLSKKFGTIGYDDYVATQMQYDKTPGMSPNVTSAGVSTDTYDGMDIGADAGSSIPTTTSTEPQLLLKKFIRGFKSIVDGVKPSMSECETKIATFLSREEPENENSSEYIVQYMAEYISLIMEASACEAYGWFGSSVASMLLMNSLLQSLYIDESGEWSPRQMLVLNEIEAGLQSGNNIEYYQGQVRAILRNVYRAGRKITEDMIAELLPKKTFPAMFKWALKISVLVFSNLTTFAVLSQFGLLKWSNAFKLIGFTIFLVRYGLIGLLLYGGDVAFVSGGWIALAIYYIITFGVVIYGSKYYLNLPEILWKEMKKAIEDRNMEEVKLLVEVDGFDLTVEYEFSKDESDTVIVFARKTAPEKIEMIKYLEEETKKQEAKKERKKQRSVMSWFKRRLALSS